MTTTEQDIDKTIQQLRDELPPFTDDATGRLKHTVAAFVDARDSDLAILATGGVYEEHPTTGLTWGDLREILRRLED